MDPVIRIFWFCKSWRFESVRQHCYGQERHDCLACRDLPQIYHGQFKLHPGIAPSEPHLGKKSCVTQSLLWQALRLFVGEPVWTPHNRPADEMPARKQYVDTLTGSEEQPLKKPRTEEVSTAGSA